MQRNDLTAITIPRSYLQNPGNEDSLVLWLSNETRCQRLGQIIDDIKTANLSSYKLVVDDNDTLNDQESDMLSTALDYIVGHFNDLKKVEPTPSLLSSSAAASCDVDMISAKTPAETIASGNDSTKRTNHATPTNDLSADAETTTETIATENDATKRTNHATPTSDIPADEEPLNLPLNANSSNNHQPASNSGLILNIILRIINLTIWEQKGNKFFYHTLPEGIDEMRQFAPPSLDAIFAIAVKQSQKPKQTTRTNMTGRFYGMLTTLHADTMLACSENAAQETLAAFCKNELIVDFNNKNNNGLFYTFRRVVLPDEDVTTLCQIANIQPSEIGSLAHHAAATNAAAADEVPQTELRP